MQMHDLPPVLWSAIPGAIADLGQTSVKITEKFDNFRSRKYIQNGCLRNGDHFEQADHITFPFPVIEPYIEKRPIQRPFGSIS